MVLRGGEKIHYRKNHRTSSHGQGLGFGKQSLAGQCSLSKGEGMGVGAMRERFDEKTFDGRKVAADPNLLRQAPLGPHTGSKTDLPKHTPSTEWQPGWVERKGCGVSEEQEGVTSNDKDGQGGGLRSA